MQTYKDDELIDTRQGEIDALAKRLKELVEEQGATHAVISLMPRRGEVVVIKGLQYKVKSMSVRQKLVHLELLDPQISQAGTD